MSSRCLSVLLMIFAPAFGADQRVLRVCADPNNLPFSNEAGEGFENRLATLIARDLGARLEYTWLSQRKSFVKNSIDAGHCDLLTGVPASMGSVTVTKPYYRSTYVFVSREHGGDRIASLYDRRLENLRIGIHVVGDDYAPPAHALARRGLSANLVGYRLFGKYGEQNPPARLIEAVAAGDIDLAIVWGPFAGYFAQRSPVALSIVPVSPPMFLAVPFTYDIALGVRKGDTVLQAELDRVLVRECGAVRSLLAEYRVPLVERGEGRQECESTPESSSPSSR